MTKCGWLWLCTTVSMGMKITNGWKIFRYGVRRDHYGKFISIRDLLEQLAMDCFSNTFTKETGTPTKNIPYLDDIDVCVLTGLRNGQYDQIMRWWSSKPHSGIATVLDSVDYCYLRLPHIH